MQRLDFKGKWFSRLVDRLGTRWLRLSAKVASGAMSHARLRQVQRIFCGHTHVALYREQGGVEYYNAGSWTDAMPTYLTVGAEGVRIHEYPQGSEAPSSEQEPEEAELLEGARYQGVGG